MTSNINPDFPIALTPTTASVRNNFQSAHDEITTLQTTVAGLAPLASPTFTGDPKAPTAAPGDSDTSIASTAFVQAAVAPALHNVGRNFLHNPLFNVLQRGAGPFGGGVLNADRWWTWIGSGDVINTVINGASDAIRAEIGDEACQFAPYITFTGASGAANLVLFEQNIEGVRRLSGKTVTVSFWASGAAGQKVGVSIDQNFGSGGSPSANVVGVGQAVTIASAWARYTVTISMPSAAGKTLGTAGGDMSQLNFWLSAGSNWATASGGVGVQSGGVAFWGVQLEIGSVATPLEKPDPQQDLAKCQRFFCISGLRTDGMIASGTYGVSSSIALPVAMRAMPTISQVADASVNVAGISYTAINAGVVTAVGSVAAGSYALFVSFWASADL